MWCLVRLLFLLGSNSRGSWSRAFRQQKRGASSRRYPLPYRIAVMIGIAPLPVYSTDLVVIVSMNRHRISGCGMISRPTSPSQVCSRSCLGGVRSPFLLRILYNNHSGAFSLSFRPRAKRGLRTYSDCYLYCYMWRSSSLLERRPTKTKK
jgi:hypothetical protein